MTGVDAIGALYDVPADPEARPVRLWGYHVNVTAEILALRPDLADRVYAPATLRRVWAGDDRSAPVLTVPLRFNGETAAREALGSLWPAPAGLNT